MAKEDFCFTYYDGDACRDMSHMNRLERGAYNDIVLQQRKFGWLTIEQIKKILGRDFAEVWDSISLVLVFDEVKKQYYVDWLHKSVAKMKTHSQLQSKRAKSKKEAELEPDVSRTEAEPQPNECLKENENGDVIGFEYELKEQAKQKIHFLKLDLPPDKIKLSQEIFTDELWVENLKMTHRGKDIRQAWEECFIHFSASESPPREIWQWRQKLNTWLSNTKTSKNGISKKAGETNSRREAFARKHGTGTDG